METWKDAIGYEGYYRISDCGRIMNTGGLIMAQNMAGHGYPQISFKVNRIRKNYYVHRLVAAHFIDNPHGLPQVNHKDEVKTNNNVCNLEWCTNAYNRHYGTGIQRAAQKRDYRKIAAAVSHPVDQFDCDGNLVKAYKSIADAKRETGAQNISGCCRNIIKHAGGYVWRYA